MAAVSTNIKIDPELKREAQELFNELGLSLSTAINIFLRQAVREQAIPFRIGAHVTNAETLKATEETEEDTALRCTFPSVDELIKKMKVGK